MYNYPIKVVEGEDASFQLELARLDGSKYDLTGCDVVVQVRNRAGDFILSPIASIVDPIGGVLKLMVSRDQTIGKAGSYIWDMWIRSSSGNDYLESSRFVIRPSVSGVKLSELMANVPSVSAVVF